MQNLTVGWVTQKMNGDYMLWHLGVTKSFIALQLVAPTAKNAILLATNVNVSHRHLINAAMQIKKHYASEANLPEIIGIY